MSGDPTQVKSNKHLSFDINKLINQLKMTETESEFETDVLQNALIPFYISNADFKLYINQFFYYNNI